MRPVGSRSGVNRVRSLLSGDTAGTMTLRATVTPKWCGAVIRFPWSDGRRRPDLYVFGVTRRTDMARPRVRRRRVIERRLCAGGDRHVEARSGLSPHAGRPSRRASFGRLIRWNVERVATPSFRIEPDAAALGHEELPEVGMVQRPEDVRGGARCRACREQDGFACRRSTNRPLKRCGTRVRASPHLRDGPVRRTRDCGQLITPPAADLDDARLRTEQAKFAVGVGLLERGIPLASRFALLWAATSATAAETH